MDNGRIGRLGIIMAKKKVIKRKFKTSPYKRGYKFEKRVQRFYEEIGFFVVRQGKSAFPDLIVISEAFTSLHGGHSVTMIECKINGIISKQEKERARELIKKGFMFKVAYREGKKLLFKEVKL